MFGSFARMFGRLRRFVDRQRAPDPDIQQSRWRMLTLVRAMSSAGRRQSLRTSARTNSTATYASTSSTLITQTAADVATATTRNPVSPTSPLSPSPPSAVARTVVKRKVLHEEQTKTASSSIPVEDTLVVKEQQPVKGKKRRKKAVEEPTPAEYPPRVDCDWKIGAHVSAAGGVENAVKNAAAIGANAFALFLKSQRKWTSPDLTDESITLFKTRLNAFGYSPSHVLPHGSYLINLGNPDPEKREKAYTCFLDDLKRCESLGLTLYNFHPGSTVGLIPVDECLSLIAECLNRAHKETSHVVTVIENTAGAGNVIGSSFTDIAGIIEKVEDKTRVGVCLDTCHMFAAGYDIRSKEAYESTIHDFNSTVGLSYLRGMHINDSKVALGSKRDRHENIGLGHLCVHTFTHIVTDPRLKDIPLILETPTFESPNVWRTEIDVLNRLAVAGRSRLDSDMDNKADTDAVDGLDLDEMVEGIRQAARDAGAQSKKNDSMKGTRGKGTKKGKKTKSQDEIEDEYDSDLTPLNE